MGGFNNGNVLMPLRRLEVGQGVVPLVGFEGCGDRICSGPLSSDSSLACGHVTPIFMWHPVRVPVSTFLLFIGTSVGLGPT